MKLVALAMLFGATTSQGLIEEKPGQWLVLQFPDGVRGGNGRIRGQAVVSKEDTRKATSWVYQHLDQARRCGAVEPMYSDNVSHSVFIVSWSTKTDHDVVSCFKRETDDRFNAGVAPVGKYSIMRYDPAPFRDLEEPADQPPAKAD